LLQHFLQQPDFQGITNMSQDFESIKRLADKTFCTCLQGAFLMLRLSSNHQNGKRLTGLDFLNFLQTLHDLESIHFGHHQVEQDEIVPVPAVKAANVKRIRCKGYRNIAGCAKHASDQFNVVFPIIYDQNARIEDIGRESHLGPVLTGAAF